MSPNSQITVKLQSTYCRRGNCQRGSPNSSSNSNFSATLAPMATLIPLWTPYNLQMAEMQALAKKGKKGAKTLLKEK